VAGNPLDARLPKTPKYKMTFYPEYDLLLPNDTSLRAIVAFTYTAEMFNDSLNTPELRDPATRMLDASVHYLWSDSKYDLALGGTNITNDRFITTGSPNIGAGELGGTYNEPAEWYLQLTAKFK
jgi:iron complex outermembrane recepter protein